MSSKAPDAAVASKLNADNASRALKEAWQQSRPEEAKRALQSLLADASSAKAGCGKSEAARALRELSEALPALFREAWALSALEKTLFYDSGSKHVPRAVKSAHGVLGCRLIHRAFRCVFPSFVFGGVRQSAELAGLATAFHVGTRACGRKSC
eukprot:scaffold895_cov315-Pinguiococcus_pyrenoidosus.AAC.71